MAERRRLRRGAAAREQSMSTTVSCPCGTSFRVPSGMGGGRALCPHCQCPVRVGAAGPPPVVPIIPLPAPPVRRPPRVETRLWVVGSLLLAAVLTAGVGFVIYRQ